MLKGPWPGPHPSSAGQTRSRAVPRIPSEPVIGLLLLAVVALCAVPMAVVRAVLGLAVGWLIGALSGWDSAPLVTAVAFASYPFVMAMAAFIDVGLTRRRWTRNYGAVEPTDDEVGVVEGALAELRQRGAPVPSRWAIWSQQSNNACVHGRTLLVGAGEVRSPLLLALLAHEAGHLRGPVPDGRLVAAFGWLVPPRLPGVVRRAWILHARRREYLADAYAMHLGLGSDFTDRLAGSASSERHQRWWSLESSHPRIGRRLKRLARRSPTSGELSPGRRRGSRAAN